MEEFLNSQLGQRVITLDYKDKQDQIHHEQFTYAELPLQLGDEWLSLEEALWEEARRLEEYQGNVKIYQTTIEELHQVYDQMDRAIYFKVKPWQSPPGPDDGLEARLDYLQSYYTLPGTRHRPRLEKLTTYLLAASEGDHSPHEITLLQFVVDYTCRIMRPLARKTRIPAVFHAIEAARGVAKNGQDSSDMITIIATLLHDVIEERLDEWTKERIRHILLHDERYAAYRPTPEQDPATFKPRLPSKIRVEILSEIIDDYNNHASGFFYSMGVALFSHIQKLPVPQRYYEMLHSIMDMVARLSRTPDQSYYQYIQQLLDPARETRDPIDRETLLRILGHDFEEPGSLLDLYVRRIDRYYNTPAGRLYSHEEAERNVFREALGKVLDRLNNTRDMPHEHFSIPSRLYGAGFKNIYLIQTISDHLDKAGIPHSSRNLIASKFLNKIKIAGLYQLLTDIEGIRKESPASAALVEHYEKEIKIYKRSPAFWELTQGRQKDEAASEFDGIVLELFNPAIHGDKDALSRLKRSEHRGRLVACLIAFREVFEAYITYSALIWLQLKSGWITHHDDSNYPRYRITGLDPQLVHSEQEVKSTLDIKTFKREVHGIPNTD